MNIDAKPSDIVKIDDAQDCIFIAGARVSCDLFRAFAQPSEPGRWFRIVSVDDAITIEARFDDPALQAARAALSHWDEFGPEHGLDEVMEGLRRALPPT